MTQVLRNHVTDLRGATRMVVDAIIGVTELVEAMQSAIAERPTRLAGAVVGGAINGTTSIVYESIRGVTAAIGGGIDLALGALAPALGQMPSSAARESVIAALNGVLGDYLAQTGNPLAVTMHLRRDGKPLELTRNRLAAAIPAPSSKVLIAIHGLCRNDRHWERDGHDHGVKLSRDLFYTTAYLCYNTGLHISTNGRALAQILEELVAAWPVPLNEVSILAHSMGGLVARSAPLERAGHWFNLLLERTPYAAPLAVLGKMRSSGITDLRHGYVLEEHWEGHDRFANRRDSYRSLPLPKGVRCYTMAAAIGRGPTPRRDQLIGDGLVPVASALGDHRDLRRRLSFPRSRQWTARGTSHFGLLGPGPVYERIHSWLKE